VELKACNKVVGNTSQPFFDIIVGKAMKMRTVK